MRSGPPDVRTRVDFVARGRNAMTPACGDVMRTRSSYRRPGLIAKRFCSSVVSGGLGWITTVPSQLIPEKPIAILSMTPSRTDVMTTSAKTPSMRSVSVRIERSLCAQSSTNPPTTTSQTMPSRAPQGRRRATRRFVPPAARATLLIPQRLHRREAARLPGGVKGEEEAKGCRECEGPGEARGPHVERGLEEGRDRLREEDAAEEAEESAEDRQDERLGHEALENLAARRADRHLDPDLANALLEGRHLDVHVDHAPADERQDSREH